MTFCTFVRPGHNLESGTANQQGFLLQPQLDSLYSRLDFHFFQFFWRNSYFFKKINKNNLNKKKKNLDSVLQPLFIECDMGIQCRNLVFNARNNRFKDYFNESIWYIILIPFQKRKPIFGIFFQIFVVEEVFSMEAFWPKVLIVSLGCEKCNEILVLIFLIFRK